MIPYYILLCSLVILIFQFISEINKNRLKAFIIIIAFVPVGLSFYNQSQNDAKILQERDSTNKYRDLLKNVNYNGISGLRKSDSLINLNLKLAQILADSTKSILQNLSTSSLQIKSAISGGEGLLYLRLSTYNGEKLPVWQLINPNDDVHYDVSISIIDHEALEAGDKINNDGYAIFDSEYLRRNSSNINYEFVNKKDLFVLPIPVKSSIIYSKYLIKISTRNKTYYQDYIRQLNREVYRIYKIEDNKKIILSEWPNKTLIKNWNLHFQYTFTNIKSTNLKEYRESLIKKPENIRIIPRRVF